MTYLPQQSREVSQGWNSRAGPTQGRPQRLGGGLSHVRRRSTEPRPHVAEHRLHGVQGPQLPSAVETELSSLSSFFFFFFAVP